MKQNRGSIADFVCHDNGRALRWRHDGISVTSCYPNTVVAVPFADGSGVLVVDPMSDDAPDNAIILNPSGSFRVRVKNPGATKGAICFGDAYYVLDEMTLIVEFSSWQMACVVDSEGKVLRTYETR